MVISNPGDSATASAMRRVAANEDRSEAIAHARKIIDRLQEARILNIDWGIRGDLPELADKYDFHSGQYHSGVSAREQQALRSKMEPVQSSAHDSLAKVKAILGYPEYEYETGPDGTLKVKKVIKPDLREENRKFFEAQAKKTEFDPHVRDQYALLAGMNQYVTSIFSQASTQQINLTDQDLKNALLSMYVESIEKAKTEDHKSVGVLQGNGHGSNGTAEPPPPQAFRAPLDGLIKDLQQQNYIDNEITPDRINKFMRNLALMVDVSDPKIVLPKKWDDLVQTHGGVTNELVREIHDQVNTIVRSAVTAAADEHRQLRVWADPPLDGNRVNYASIPVREKLYEIAKEKLKDRKYVGELLATLDKPRTQLTGFEQVFSNLTGPIVVDQPGESLQTNRVSRDDTVTISRMAFGLLLGAASAIPVGAAVGYHAVTKAWDAQAKADRTVDDANEKIRQTNDTIGELKKRYGDQHEKDGKTIRDVVEENRRLLRQQREQEKRIEELEKRGRMRGVHAASLIGEEDAPAVREYAGRMDARLQAAREAERSEDEKDSFARLRRLKEGEAARARKPSEPDSSKNARVKMARSKSDKPDRIERS